MRNVLTSISDERIVPNVKTVAHANPLGTEVRRRREAAGLSQQALASRANIAMRTLARIEQGEDVRLATLDALAAALGTTSAVLLAPAPSEGEAHQ